MAKRKTTRVRETPGAGRQPNLPPPASFVVTRYIESSALVAALLEHDERAHASIRGDGRRVTSALTLAEVARALVRARVAGRLTSAQERAAVGALHMFARRCDIVAVTDAVLMRVGRPFPVEPIRTLDAMHLASAELLGDAPQLTTIVTRDARVRDNARALGYLVE